MSTPSDLTFHKFKANTLKALIKWIKNPNDPRSRRLLEKNIPGDLKNYANKAAKGLCPKSPSKPVRTQLGIINAWPQHKMQWAQQVIADTSLLLNSQFINNILNKTIPNRQDMLNHNNPHSHLTKTKTKTKPTHRPKPQPPTPTTPSPSQSRIPPNINPTTNTNIITKTNSNTIPTSTSCTTMTPFKYLEGNKLIHLLQVKQQNVTKLKQSQATFQRKLSTLQKFAKSMPNLVDTMSPITKELEQISQQIENTEYKISVIMQVIHKIRKQEDKLLKCKKPKT